MILCAALAQLLIGAWFERTAARSSPYHAEAGFPLDDAWIHLVYARSIAEHGRPEYNPGVLEAGQSSLLWGALLAPVVKVASWIDAPVARAVRLFGILMWIACAFAAALVARRLPVPAPRFASVAAAALVALDPRSAFAAVSGMEPLLMSACALFAIAALQRDRFVLAGILAGLTVLARPEGVIVAVLIALAAAANGGDRAGRARRVGSVVLPIVALGGAWVALCLAATGRPLPNTFYVKAAVIPLVESVPSAGLLLGGAIRATPFLDTWVGYLFLAMGALAFVVRCGARLAIPLLGTPLAFALGVAATRSLPDPDAFFWSRYIEPIRPFLLLAIAIGMATAVAVIVDLMKKRAARVVAESAAAAAAAPNTPPALEPEPRATMLPDPVIAVILLACLLLMFGTIGDRLGEASRRYADNVRDVDSLNVWVARWLADESKLPRDAWIATQDAGAVRFFQDRPVIDLIGLNDHELVAHGLAGGALDTYLARKRPSAWCLLDPDPGATELTLLAIASGMHEAVRVRVNRYSLFGEPAPKAFVVWADLPPK